MYFDVEITPHPACVASLRQAVPLPRKRGEGHRPGDRSPSPSEAGTPALRGRRGWGMRGEYITRSRAYLKIRIFFHRVPVGRTRRCAPTRPVCGEGQTCVSALHVSENSGFLSCEFSDTL